MSTSDSTPTKTGVKTLAIRLEPELHAKLSIVAQLRGSTITDEIRQAIETHIEATKNSSDLAAKADSVLEDIERDASTRREAIATLFGGEAPAEKTRTRSRKTAGEEPSLDS